MGKQGAKRLVFISVIYIVVLAGIAAFFMASGRDNYLGFKKEVEKAKSEIKTGSASDDSNNATTESTATNGGTNSNAATSGSANNQTASSNEKTSTAASNAATNTEGNDGTYSNVKFSRAININTQGDDVRRVQYILKSKNLYTGNITGTYDASTQEAVKAFQKSQGIGQDGVIGPSTWAKLNQ